MHRRLIGNVPPSNRRINVRKFRDKLRAMYFLFKITQRKCVAAAKEKRDKEKDRIKGGKKSSNWRSTYAILRPTFIFNGIDGWKKLGAQVNKRRR